ncbi:bifunctional phosphoribosyl-AMP cyclohydrolase/phosphoribosyl-ATP diphosphatase HisIE [Flavobacterium sp. '19STA2R22 D10 B1']|uniref:bifunctional phosphoribosyl-AMP cyclohydrolase/phosphoribosyl-ATP diphosphatase HisIE n=1 Tax=Flavobacterium aerium TaxID=3037261 RepID=UPI00278C8A33|nr:bifunctional phosphoribosyl-AMP cyclohydrolase/phosphoribosyl-ATP diphosphatase HisIE [Flavobacterium sp. '19STA2R22 D10 B1']
MRLDFEKNNNGLIPAIIQDNETRVVLMLGYMNEAAYKQTIETKKVTFFSRTKNKLWVKGEESGNFLNLVSLSVDCDNDTLLIKVTPDGPTCHKGTDSCWQESNTIDYGFLSVLETIIDNRKEQVGVEGSYIASLFQKGINKIAQKVGEEAVEVVIEAKDNNPVLFLNESADLLFHYLILLQAKGFRLSDVASIMKERHLQR